MKKIKKIGVVSLGKVIGMMYVIMSIIIGGVAGVFFILFNLSFSEGNKGVTLFIGLAIIILPPIIYGSLGFIIGAFSGWIYNLSAKWSGGIELEFQDGE